MRPYRPAINSVPWQAIQRLAVDLSLTSEELAVALRVRRHELPYRLRSAIHAGFIYLKDGVYSPGPVTLASVLAPRPSRGKAKSQRMTRGVIDDPIAMRQHHGSLRELVSTGSGLDVGNPLRELADLQEMARAVIAAKATSRYKGAEVDVVVARELRSVAQGMAQAAENLKRYLEVMS